jgi:hypothetical protein
MFKKNIYTYTVNNKQTYIFSELLSKVHMNKH